MAVSFDKTMQGPSGDAKPHAPAPGVPPEFSSDAGATLSIAELNTLDPHAWYLTDREAETLRIGNSSHYRAKMFIPCLGQRCPGRMQLRFLDAQKRELPRAYYLCENKQCRYSHEENKVHPEDIRASWITESHRVKPSYKSNESLTREEMETMI